MSFWRGLWKVILWTLIIVAVIIAVTAILIVLAALCAKPNRKEPHAREQ